MYDTAASNFHPLPDGPYEASNVQGQATAQVRAHSHHMDTSMGPTTLAARSVVQYSTRAQAERACKHCVDTCHADTLQLNKGDQAKGPLWPVSSHYLLQVHTTYSMLLCNTI